MTYNIQIYDWNRSFGGNIKVDLDLSSYATKAELKNSTGVDTSKVAAKFALASLKAQIDKIDNDKLKTVNTTVLPQLIARWTAVMCEVLNLHRQDCDWSSHLALLLQN